jgi:hypothetical protein
MSSRPELRLDWCSHAAAKYACETWHYSGTMPVSKSVKVGVWEGGQFAGAVIFAWGANPNIGKPYGLPMLETAELSRVALRAHATPVSRILAIAQKMFAKQSPGVRLLVSYADTAQGHHGGIYQASGWIYAGTTSPKTDFMLRGQKLQRRSYTGRNFGAGRLSVPAAAVKVDSPCKHRYLMPLDDDMRAKIAPLAKPYPKRAGSSASGTSPDQGGRGGATPTPALSSFAVSSDGSNEG